MRKLSVYLLVICLMMPMQFVSYSNVAADTIETEDLIDDMTDIYIQEAEVESEHINSEDEMKVDDSVEISPNPETTTVEDSESENEESIDIEVDVTDEKQVAGVKAVGITENKTSKLGHIRSRNVLIYNSIGGTSFEAGATLTNAVYYIKREAKKDSDTYYLISTQPSDVKGVVGWVKSSDLSIHNHVGVDKKAKTLYINGNGRAKTKAWGGSKDTVYSDLTAYQNKEFKVDLTEKVGNNTWYRGIMNGKRVWLHSNFVYDANKSKTSKLGHIKRGNVNIYEAIGGKSFAAGSTYTNAVYYIKEQAVSGTQMYYLISTSPSSTSGVVGWVKSSDLSVHNHIGVDNTAKIMRVKGNGKATTKAWGGKKNDVYSSLRDLKNELLYVDLTEKVGNNTWYRGMLKGKRVWLHSSYVDEVQTGNTSLLGHIRSGSVQIYNFKNTKVVSAGSQYTNAVYYIKKEAKAGNETLYLISTQPSSTKGIVGWVKASDMSVHRHVGVDKKGKLFYIKGTGKATTKAWGGNKDSVYNPLTSLSGELFSVNLTEKVGNNTWYRGILKGKQVWVHSSQVVKTYDATIDYRLTLNAAIDIQWKALQDNNQVLIKPTKAQIRGMMDPANFATDSKQRFQFLSLKNPSGATASMLNKYLNNNSMYEGGSLRGQGEAFYEAARKHNMNDIYILAHTRLETGNGKSPLSNGSIRVGEYGKNKWLTVRKDGQNNDLIHIVECIPTGDSCQWKVTKNNYINPSDAKNMKPTYNMFGIGAIDGYANEVGSVTAYRNGWTNARKAIVEGVGWIKGSYINNQHDQNTLYKMRWNPNMVDGAAWKQYATDIGWASKQANIMYDLYQAIGVSDIYYFDIPVYK